MLDVILSNIPAILTVLIGLGVVWKYASKILGVVKEVQELLITITSALADRKLTPEEVDDIIKEVKDVKSAVLKALGKDKDEED